MMPPFMIAKKKKKMALWVETFPDQAKALRPETSKAGGVRWRSKSQAVMLEVYNGIAEMFKTAHPLCQCCMFRVNVNQVKPNWTDDIHHRLGKDGLLLFDVRYFVAMCRQCHSWAH
jgi:hypothetical protein